MTQTKGMWAYEINKSQQFANLKSLIPLESFDSAYKAIVNPATVNRAKLNTDYLDADNGMLLVSQTSSNNYLKAAEKGLSIFEFAPVATAVDREYWTPLLRWLASPKSIPGTS